MDRAGFIEKLSKECTTGVDYSTDKKKDGARSDLKAMGTLGEHFARGYLKEHGFQIVQAPFRCRSGEIDVIAMDGETMVFVEVKTRRSQRFGSPLEAVTPAKQRQIAKIAKVYLSYYNQTDFKYCRFDVLGIIVHPSTGENQVEHIKDAFRLDSSGYSFSC